MSKPEKVEPGDLFTLVGYKRQQYFVIIESLDIYKTKWKTFNISTGRYGWENDICLNDKKFYKKL